jgi:undecaprenyl-diphosphatase
VMDISSLLELDYRIFDALNGSGSLFLDGVMTTLTSGLTWIPLYISLLYLIIKNNETMAQIMLIVGCCFLCIFFADGITDFIVKPIVARWRPSNDPYIKYTVDVVNNVRGGNYGFFSAHAANTFSIALFFSFLVRNKVFNFCLLTWSLINCYTRIYLGLHYPSDILCGLLWGSVVAIIVYVIYHKIYAKISPKLNYISTQYTSTGYSLTDIDMVISILMFTYSYAIIRALI